MMHLRKATIDDLDDMVDLLTILFQQEEEFEPDIVVQRKGLRMILQNSEMGEIFVGKKGQNVIGMVSLLYSISTALGSKVATLEDLIIHPEYRSQGYGQRLLQYVLNYAREKGLKRVTLLTDSNNDSAIRFYLKNGFQNSRMIIMRSVL